MPFYVKYDDEGFIRGQGYSIENYTSEIYSVLLDVQGSAETHYVDLTTTPGTPELKAKISFPLTWDSLTVSADGSSKITLGSGDLPVPTYFSVVNKDLGVNVIRVREDSGTLEITFDSPGVYQVTIETLEYELYSVEIEAI